MDLLANGLGLSSFLGPESGLVRGKERKVGQGQSDTDRQMGEWEGVRGLWRVCDRLPTGGEGGSGN